MRVLICGGREFGRPNWDENGRIIKDHKHDEYRFGLDTITRILDERGCLDNEYKMPIDVTIIHGGATGADMIGDSWAIINWAQKIELYEADWFKHGKAAGFIRNQQMLDEGKPDLVIAFPGGKGTADMVHRAKKAGVEVIEVAYHNDYY